MILIGFCGCSESSDIPASPEEAIIGKWKEVARRNENTSLEPSLEISEFKADGSYRSLSHPDEVYTYKIDADYLYYCSDDG